MTRSPTVPAAAGGLAADARGRILDAGRRLFAELGFGSVTTARIAAEAAVSKATLYREFDGLAGVLEAIADREVDKFAPPAAAPSDDLGGLMRQLASYGASILTALNDPANLALSRLMMEEARAHPDLARRFYDAAYGRTLSEIAALLDDAAARGLVRLAVSAATEAEGFLGQLEGMGLTRAHLMMTDRPYLDPGRTAARTADALITRIGSKKSV